MKEIILSGGYVAMVSDEDFAAVSEFKWSASHESRNDMKTYAVRMLVIGSGKERRRKRVAMHRFIMGRIHGEHSLYGMVVDHLDGDGLNNCRDNLEIVTQEENMSRADGYKKYQKSF